MPETDSATLKYLDSLLVKFEFVEAERLLSKLVQQLRAGDDSISKDDLIRRIDRLPNKRRRVLSDSLAGVESNRGPRTIVSKRAQASEPIGEYQLRLRSAFATLRESHIFQWNTFYLRLLSAEFDAILGSSGGSGPTPAQLVTVLAEELKTHSAEIYRKGYERVSGGTSELSDGAVRKACGGLQSFLQLPIRLLAERSSSSISPTGARLLRHLCSASLTAILRGFCTVRYGETSGAELLPIRQSYWLQSLGFARGSDCAAFLKDLGDSEIRNLLIERLQPFLDAVDVVDAASSDLSCLVMQSTHRLDSSRLEISIARSDRLSPAEWITSYVDLGRLFDRPDELLYASSRRVQIVVARFGALVNAQATADSTLSKRMFEIQQDEGAPSLSSLIGRRLLRLIQQVGASADVSFYRQNVARLFPIQSLREQHFYYVQRPSVEALLRDVEGSPGAYLWSSARRSGKSTASRRLSSSTGLSRVVVQSCTTVDKDAGRFYEGVRQAVKDGTAVAGDFVARLIAECGGLAPSEGRTAFVLDEYEALFETLNDELSERPVLRTRIVQPILDQLAGFASENVLILLGLQPDAYDILPEQNQLSPLVQRKHFPLFAFKPEEATSEFAELLVKILGGDVTLERTFMQAVFDETGGHPYLTANVLTDFCDWIIGSNSQRPLRLEGVHFDHFARERLNRAVLGTSQEYDFFLKQASESMKPALRLRKPWVYAVHRLLQLIVQQSPDRFLVSVEECGRLMQQSGVLGVLNCNQSELLRTACNANFLVLENGTVRPAIRLLARLCAVTGG